MSSDNTQPNLKSSGVAPHIASLLCYLLMIVTAGLPLSGGIFLIIEQQNQEVRFHAWQSILLGLAWVTTLLIVGMLEYYLGQFSAILGWGLAMVRVILLAAIVLTWCVCLLKTYRQELWRIPFLGDWAAQRAERG